MGELLRIEDLSVSFETERGLINVLDRASFSIAEGETHALVGESGSGKSVSSLAILRLLPEYARLDGKIVFGGTNPFSLTEKQMESIRGKEIAMVFQEPMTSLNPVFTAGFQIAEAVRIHERVSKKAARARAIELLKLVRIATPETNVDAYPHQLSGGMRQRVMIAMALSCNPKLLIADEPTTALDVTIQAQILELLGDLQKRLGLSILLVTHDLGVVSEFAKEITVLYGGTVVETGKVADVFAAPKHPYTAGLLRSLPKLHRGKGRPSRLEVIRGNIPPAGTIVAGCRFAARCDLVLPACEAEKPPWVALPDNRFSRCLRTDAMPDKIESDKIEPDEIEVASGASS